MRRDDVRRGAQVLGCMLHGGLCVLVLLLGTSLGTVAVAQEVGEQELDPELEALRQEAEALAGPDGSEVSGRRVEASPTVLPNAMNPQITVFGDLVFVADPETLGRPTSTVTPPVVEDDAHGHGHADVYNRFSAREVEIDFRAAVDPYASAVVIVGIEEVEPRSYGLDLEEAYLTFPDLPGGTLLRVGRFRSPIGQLNRLHLHDLPMPTLPLPSAYLLGDEGDVSLGMEASWLMPVSEQSAMTWMLALTNAENRHLFSGQPGPAWIGRVSNFFDLSSVSFLELGASYLGGFENNARNHYRQLLAADLLLKLRPEHRPDLTSWVLQAEVFYTRRQHEGLLSESLGTFGMVLYQFDRNWSASGRFEALRGEEEGHGAAKEHSAWGWRTGAALSYYTTEFLRLRLNYDFRHGDGGEHLVTAQATFVFGSHPVEPYWFSR